MQKNNSIPDNDVNSKLDLILIQIEEFRLDIKSKESRTYLTKKEVAQMFKVNLSTIHNWTKKGILNPVGLGGRRYFLLSDIERSIVELKICDNGKR